MTTRHAAAAALIEESVMQTMIAHATHTEALHGDLLVECEDWAEHGHVVEYWGTTDSGSTWRVHLTREESRA